MQAQLVLDIPDESGVSLRKKLNQVWEQNHILDPRLSDEPLPMVAGAYLLNWFWELNCKRKMVSLGMGAMQGPIDWSDIKDWAFLKKIDLSPWEVSAINALDNVYLMHYNKKG